MESPVLLPLGVGDLVEVVGGRAHIGRMGFVERADDTEFISIVEIQGKMVLYFSLEIC
jgi:hypothetical protein